MSLSSRASSLLSSGETTLRYAQLGEKSRVKPVIDLTLGQPDVPPPSTLVELLAAESRAAGASRYAPPAGLQELREAIAYHVREAYGLDVNPRRVVVLAGAKPGIAAVVYAVCDPGDYVVALTPHFYAYINVPQMFGVRVVLVRLSWESGRLRVNSEALKEAVSRYKPKLLIVNTPHNPTGLLLDPGDVKLVIDLANDHDILVLSDEVYSWLVYRGEHKPLATLEPGRVVHLESFSKTLAIPGWRVGFLLSPTDELAKAAAFFNSNVYTCIPRFIQQAVAKYITSYRDDMIAFVEELRATYQRRSEALLSALSRLSGLVEAYQPEAGFFLFPNVARLLRALGLRDARELAEKLAVEAGVLVVPGTVFGEWGRHIRVSLTASEQKLREAVLRIASLVERRV